MMDVETLASEMLGISIRSCEPIKGGGNTKIYKILTNDTRLFALKFYGDVNNPLDVLRLEREYEGLSFLWQQGERGIARPFISNTTNVCAAYQWIEGENVKQSSFFDIDQVLDFIQRLKQYSSVSEAKKLKLASDNCLDQKAVIQQIIQRYERLKLASTDSSLVKFLKAEFTTFFESCLKDFKGQKNSGSLSLDKAILSPSDFGFHNMLRREKGQLVFIDFEYFGWEDPAAMLAHFLWHPGMALTEEQKKYFIINIKKLFLNDSTFDDRYQTIFPLIGLIWVLILLNEFIPEVWSRRVRAGKALDTEWRRVTDAQLSKANEYLQQLR